MPDMLRQEAGISWQAAGVDGKEADRAGGLPKITVEDCSNEDSSSDIDVVGLAEEAAPVRGACPAAAEEGPIRATSYEDVRILQGQKAAAAAARLKEGLVKTEEEDAPEDLSVRFRDMTTQTDLSMCSLGMLGQDQTRGLLADLLTSLLLNNNLAKGNLLSQLMQTKVGGKFVQLCFLSIRLKS